ncbi:MAG: ATP-binding cassette domain-containing protein [Desulfurococcales archaeon]|nr:ATP-binding cassette domain-containing protein [Desulfurococcales archaeon]
MIEVRKASVLYEDGSWGLREADFTAERGEFIALTGPNGGGKTTLLRLISGLIPSFYKAKVSGEVSVDGINPLTGPISLSGLVGYTQPDPSLQIVGVTVYAEAALGPAMQGLSTSEIRERAIEAISEVGLEGIMKHSTAILSSGILQRVSIAGVLSMKPKYMLLDEPTAHLDEPSAGIVLDIMKKLSNNGVGVIAATHDPRVVELADRSFIVSGSVRQGRWHGIGYVRVNRNPLNTTKSNGDLAVLARNIWASYPGGRPVLKGVNLMARYGSLISVIGYNGSGKTTLLRLLAGFIKPARGSVNVYGKRAYLPPEPIMVFSRPTLGDEIKYLSINESKLLVGRVSSILDKPIMNLSRGQLQLAALILVASTGARILLLDEPTHALDPEVKADVIEALLDLSSKGYCIIAATHDKTLASYSDEVYYIDNGVLYRE